MSIQVTFRHSSGKILAVFGLLLMFGVWFNQQVANQERRNRDDGMLSLYVALGSSVTLIGVALLDLKAAILSLCAFIATGLPMILGSLWRHADLEEKSYRNWVYDTTKTLAEQRQRS